MTLESQMIIIFGATGDLTRRKLIPSLYHLERKNRLTPCTPIICVGRRQMGREQFLEKLHIKNYIPEYTEEVVNRLLSRITYIDYAGEKGGRQRFVEKITAIEKDFGCTTNRLIYLAIPTSAFAQTARLIGSLEVKDGWRRVVFEKPFGEDLPSAQALNESIGAVLSENEIYRVDHYLGKELVQNILTLRFANEVFAGGWRERAIDQVQITVAETLGVEKRAGYYDNSGAVRDMLQNHLLQLLSFVAMEPPKDDSADALRNQAAEVLRNLRVLTDEDVVLGQYGPDDIEENSVAGYRDEEGVADASTTETYVAVRAFVDRPRWQDVPFYLRTGKRLKQRYAEIRIVYKQRSRHLVGNSGEPNMIIIRIQPDEGIALAFNVRKPGEGGKTESVMMDFCHHCHFGPNTPEAYESILYRVLKGDQSIFPRWDWLAASWKYIDGLKGVASPPVSYRAGSTGPVEAAQLPAKDGNHWIDHDPAEQVISLPYQQLK